MCNLKTMKHIIFADNMKILLFFMTFALLTGCTQTQGILLRNRTNERVKLYCYYNVNNLVDSVYIDRSDSAYLRFSSGWFVNSKRIIKEHVNHMDSIILVLQDKRIVYKDSVYIRNFLLNDKDTTNMLKTTTYPSRIN